MLRYLALGLCLSFYLKPGNGQSTISPTVTTASTGTTGTGGTTTGTGPTTTAASTSPGTTGTTVISSTTTTTSRPTGFIGPCKVRPAAANATLEMLNGQWNVMRYQSANRGPMPLPDRCDNLQIIVNNQVSQLVLNAISVANGGSDGYETETAPIRPGPTPGTFFYSLPNYGGAVEGYVTILSLAQTIGFIYDVCWTNNPSLQDLVLFATNGRNDNAFPQLRSMASDWDNGWQLQFVNHDNCPPLQ